VGMPFERLTEMWDELSGHEIRFGTILKGVVALLVVGLLVWLILCLSRGSDKPKFAALPPAEFLYVDGPRTLNYLAEMEGGQVEKIRKLSKEIRTASGGLSAWKVNVAASAQHETLDESTLTRTEWSALDLLLNDLHESDRHGASVHRVTLQSPSDLEQIREGEMVSFVTDRLVAPVYIRPYVVARQSATLGALFPDRPEGPRRAEHQRKRARIFARQVGRDPRLTFAIAPPPHRRAIAPLRILLPMHYLGLTTERSLLEKEIGSRYTGGRLVVIGKVIRRFPLPPKQKTICLPTVGGECKHRPVYADLSTQEVWRSPLEHAASGLLIGKASHHCKTRRSRYEVELAKRRANVAARQAKAAESLLETAEKGLPTLGRPRHGGLAGYERRVRRARNRSRRAQAQVGDHPLRARECLLGNLVRQTTLYTPGAVILPIAVYK
jgi:hypothetical protein